MFRGVLRVSELETATLASVAERLADLADMPDGLTEISPVRILWATPDESLETSGDAEAESENTGLPPILGSTPAAGDDAPALLLTGLVRSGVKVTGRRQPRAASASASSTRSRPTRPSRPSTRSTRTGYGSTPRSRATTGSSRRTPSAPTRASSPAGAPSASWTPNGVTAISMGISVVAAVVVRDRDQRWGMLVGGVLPLLRVRLRLRGRAARPLHPAVQHAGRLARRDVRPGEGVHRLRRPGGRLDRGGCRQLRARRATSGASPSPR